MEKEKYLLKIIPFMKDNGIDISMDAIADGIGVSKKTLYNRFSSKEELIDACLQSTSEEFKQKVSCLIDSHISVTDGFRNGIQGLREYFQNISFLFMNDCLKLSPEKMPTHNMGTDFFETLMKENILRGQKLGIYREDTDADLFAKYISSSIFSFFYKYVMKKNQYSADYYFTQVTDFNLRALLNNR